MPEKAFEPDQDKVKSVHLVNIPTKVTGLDEVTAGAQVLKRLHQSPQQHKLAVRKEPVAAPVTQRHRGFSKDQSTSGFLGILAYGIGRAISLVSNIIK